MSKLVFVSYATGSFKPMRDRLCQSASSVGFTDVIACGEEDLDLGFRQRNSDILSHKRGAGYWAWKPQIILQELLKLNCDDVLVYCDAGRTPYNRFKMRPDRLIKKARENGFITGVAIHQHGCLSKWTKRDAFIRLKMDTPMAHCSPVIQAGWSFWTPTPKAFFFLEAWRDSCEDQACLTDQENIEGFVNLLDFKDHRHDQSLSSILTLKLDASYIEYQNTMLFRILALRSKSQLAHYFLRRIDDAEAVERWGAIPSLVRSFLDLRVQVD